MLNFLPKTNRYWTTFETLAEIERVAKNDNSTLHGILYIVQYYKRIFSKKTVIFLSTLKANYESSFSNIIHCVYTIGPIEYMYVFVLSTFDLQF